jgi:hypothetical protein
MTTPAPHLPRMRVDPMRALDTIADTYPPADRCAFRARMLAALSWRVDPVAWGDALVAAQRGMDEAGGGL